MCLLLFILSLTGALMTGAAPGDGGGDFASPPHLSHSNQRAKMMAEPMAAMAMSDASAAVEGFAGGGAVASMPAPMPMMPPAAGGRFAGVFSAPSGEAPIVASEVLIREAYISAEVADVALGVSMVVDLAKAARGTVRFARAEWGAWRGLC